MQRKVLLATVLAALVAAALTVRSRPFSLGQERIPAPAPSPLPAAAQANAYLGVGSCASPACHGGPDSAENNKRRGKWNSAYTVWVEHDAHAKAYSVLYSPESKKILRNLDHLDPTADPQPYRDVRCLSCHGDHGYTVPVAKTPEEGGACLADGVGCEACHGAAREWLAEHTVRTWNKADTKTHRDTHGPAADHDGRMVNTSDMAVRAGICVDCHIGSPGAAGMPARNMDHDMIASGHPRLTFEMSAFLANMPHHWDDHVEKGRDDYAAQVWAVGQIASTQAALQLLAARARAAEAAAAAGPSETDRWPELSEYDCYTCHHGLAMNGYRQNIKSAGKPRKLGRYAWGTWYLPMTCLLLEKGPFEPANPASVLARVDRVARLLEDPIPAPSAVRAVADSAAREMQSLLDGVKKARYDRQAVDRMLQATKDHPSKSWDEACGQYLLFRNACSKDPRFTEPLAAARKLLQFRDEKRDHGPPIQYNSPRDFDPGKFNDTMNELRALLPR
jgi:hypothetical protein